ncbi:MAG: hypothetical protein Q4D16_01160 [Eubacteriales bacterium]|nr:hypothetical protein [Eubacteriales bacterium]
MNNKDGDMHRYDDIIELPHPRSASHPHMPIPDRAAQFAPFAALTGHEAAIRETARLTENRIELDDDVKEVIDEKLRMIQEMLPEHQPQIAVTYFQPDEEKAGGRYVTIRGSVKKIDAYSHSVIMADYRQIPVEEVSDIEFVSSLPVSDTIL